MLVAVFTILVLILAYSIYSIFKYIAETQQELEEFLMYIKISGVKLHSYSVVKNHVELASPKQTNHYELF